MFEETGSVHLNLILDNPITSHICINILPEEEFINMVNESNRKTPPKKAVQIPMEKGLTQKEPDEKIDLFIYQYKNTLFIRLNGKWVKLD